MKNPRDYAIFPGKLYSLGDFGQNGSKYLRCVLFLIWTKRVWGAKRFGFSKNFYKILKIFEKAEIRFIFAPAKITVLWRVLFR